MELLIDKIEFKMKRLFKRYLYDHSLIGRETIRNPGSWKILDLIYGFNPNSYGMEIFMPRHWCDKMFYFSKAAHATRARYIHYVSLMLEWAQQFAELNNNSISLLSLASGSGRDVVQVVERLNEKGIDLRSLCIDKDSEAIRLGMKLTECMKINNICYVKGKIKDIDKLLINRSFDIIITQGILDYLNDGEAKELFRRSAQLLNPGGVLITSNMSRHRWMRCWMEYFGNWRLKYRTGIDLENLLLESGFEGRAIQKYMLPQGYHWIAIARK